MTRSQALGLGLPAWTLLVVAWLFFGGASIDGYPGCARLVGLSAECAAQLNAARDASFYLGILPWVATILAGFFLLAMLTVQRRAGRLGLVAAWLALVIAFALLGRPDTILTYPG